MVHSPRPISLFANYNPVSSDVRSRRWEQRLLDVNSSNSVTLRSCTPPDLNASSSESERRLIGLVLSGDQPATIWFNRRLTTYISMLCRDAQLVSDHRDQLCRHVMAKLIEADNARIRQWYDSGRGRFTAYVGSAVRGAASQWMRLHWSRTETANPSSLRSAQSVPSPPRLSHDIRPAVHPKIDCIGYSAMNSEKKRAVRHVIATMLWRDATILRRRFLLNQSYPEIAAGMGLRENHVGPALIRAERRFRERIICRFPGLFDEAV